ncbi:MAG: hypothetical protein GY758_25785 [Fuerstiella sp.]|nr:hypothetical protein [Fuerstiella sp.]MCP4512922.1 hypothetical protein [Fuerstiella sp.]
MRSVRFIAVCTALCLFSVVLVGCGSGGKEIGPTGEVEGTVTVDGEPLAEGSVAFYNESTGNTGGAELGSGGKFVCAVPVPVGTYQVSFVPSAELAPGDQEADKRAVENDTIHDLYRSGETSEIAAEVKEGLNTFTFDLKKAGPQG